MARAFKWGVFLLKTGHILRVVIRGWRCALIVVSLAFATLAVGAEPFQPGGPIGSQTPDGYNALGPVVTQPIEFPHYIHVEKMGIDCMYCHTYARRSAVSGIPRLNKCIGCHQNIESVKDTPRIKILLDEPDFVRFNHERHIQRFIFEQGRPTREVCGYCHGDVGSMTTARRVKAISMGWCISCHEMDHKLDAVSDKTSNGPNDCWQCHK
jgi:hypothetical protein